jgi:hypothetical protein
MEEIRSAYRILVGKSLCRDSLQMQRRWGDNIKVEVKM